MARRPRALEPFAVYHINARGNRRGAIFADDIDRTWFLTSLRQTTIRYRWRCLAYSLLTNHYHLLLRATDEALPAGMRRLNATHALAFNERHGLTGHVFEDRYHSELIARQEHLLETARYIALQAVRAGICSRPEEWPWCSFAADLRGSSGVPGTEDLLIHFGDDPVRARERWRAFVEDGLGQ